MTSSGGTGQPHDALFRLVFGRPEHAASELRSVLPPALAGHIEPSSLQPVPASFVDDDLRQRHSDALFTAQIDDESAYIYVLIEHQSQPDPLMPFRLLRYVIRIWERHIHDAADSGISATSLPLIVPLVLYRGAQRWKPPTDLADLIDLTPEVRAAAGDLIPRFRHLLDDLTTLNLDALRQRTLTPAALITMRLQTTAGESTIADTLAELRSEFQAMLGNHDGAHLFSGILTYIRIVTDTPESDLANFAATIGPRAEEILMSNYETTLDKGREQGRQQGLELGEIEGRRNLLTDLLIHRFGQLTPQARASIAAASPDDLSTWSTRLIRDNPANIEDILNR